MNEHDNVELNRLINRLAGPAYVLTAILMVSLAAVFPKWTVDDAFITFRYAENLANYSELTWNVGSDPVEGYTGVALPLILALGFKAKLDPIGLSHTIGVVSLLACGILLALLLSKLCDSLPVRVLTLLLFASAPILYTHAFSGLETMLFSALVIASLYALFRVIDGDKFRLRNVVMLFALLFFTSLVRPEGVALATVIVLTLIIYSIKDPAGNPRSILVLFVITFAVPGSLYFLWRWNYYGQLLPNTYYAKLPQGVIVSRLSTFRLATFVWQYTLFPLAVAVIVNAIALKRSIAGNLSTYMNLPVEKRIIMVAGLLYIVTVSVQYSRSALIMNYSHRFFVPLFAVFLTITAILLGHGFKSLRKSTLSEGRQTAVIVAIGLVIFGQIFVQLLRLDNEMKFASDYKQLIDEVHVPIGKFAFENIPSSEWLASFYDAGAIPYYSKLKTIDFGRLNDEFLVSDPVDREVVDYFFAHRPGIAVFTSYDWDEQRYREESSLIIADERFEEYALYARYRTDARDGYFQFVYIRQDLINQIKEGA